MKCYKLYLIYFSMLLFSCGKGWLDHKTDMKQTTPTTLKDFQGLLDDDENTMNQWGAALEEVASDGHYINDINFGNTSNIDKNAYTWAKSLPNVAVNDWNYNYRRILYCNIILDGLKKVNGANLEEIKNVKGQALFQRARCFYELSQIFAPPFNPNSSSTDLSIPLRLEADVTIPSKRSTVEQTYTQIINDLLLAIDLLPSMPLIKTRGSKVAASGLLARVYLSKEDYSDAGKTADFTLSLYDSLMDYNLLSTNASFIGLFNKEVIFHNRMNSYSSLSGTRLLIDSSLVAMYDSNDLRRSLFFKRNSNNTYSWKGNYDNVTTRLFSGIATDELLLIRAECFARAGDINRSMKDLNVLLSKRWKNTVPYFPLSASNADDALVKVLTERKKELLLRGLRWSDLRRLNRDSRFAITVTRTVQGGTYTLEPNSYKYTFPIPDDIIQQTGMQQNPGWQ